MSLFGSAFSRPKPEEIHVHSKITAYESYLIISGKYEVDFYRKALHKINVDGDVTEILIGEGVFPIKSKSGVWDKFEDKMKEGIGIDKEEVEIEVEEHAIRRQSGTLTLDHHGNEVKEFQYKIDSSTIANYPRSVDKKKRIEILRIDGVTKKILN